MYLKRLVVIPNNMRRSGGGGATKRYIYSSFYIIDTVTDHIQCQVFPYGHQLARLFYRFCRKRFDQDVKCEPNFMIKPFATMDGPPSLKNEQLIVSIPLRDIATQE